MSKVGIVTYEVKVTTGFWFKVRMWLAAHLLYVKCETSELKEDSL